MSLRETILIELATFDKAPANFEGPNKRVLSLIDSLFQGIYNNDHNSRYSYYLNRGEETFDRFVKAFKLKVPANISRIDPWSGRIPTQNIDHIEVIEDDFVIFMYLSGVVKNEGTEEPVYEWVEDGPNIKRRKPVKKKGVAITKKTKDSFVTEKVLLGFHFPLSLLEDILTETEQSSLLTAPAKENYIPRPLGIHLPFSTGGSSGWDMPWMNQMHRGDFQMMTAYPSRRYSTDVPPSNYRIFLKPEAGTDRLEVEFEQCPEEDVRARAELIKQRTEWYQMNVISTKALIDFTSSVLKKV